MKYRVAKEKHAFYWSANYYNSSYIVTMASLRKMITLEIEISTRWFYAYKTCWFSATKAPKIVSYSIAKELRIFMLFIYRIMLVWCK